MALSTWPQSRYSVPETSIHPHSNNSSAWNFWLLSEMLRVPHCLSSSHSTGLSSAVIVSEKFPLTLLSAFFKSTCFCMLCFSFLPPWSISSLRTASVTYSYVCFPVPVLWVELCPHKRCWGLNSQDLWVWLKLKIGNLLMFKIKMRWYGWP